MFCCLVVNITVKKFIDQGSRRREPANVQHNFNDKIKKSQNESKAAAPHG